jgi:hypothetical protein
MTVWITSVPRDVLYLVANYLLANEEQNKQIFRFSADWRNFMNCSIAHFGEWKKQSQVVVLPTLYADKFRKSLKFRQRILQAIANPFLQLELHDAALYSNTTPTGLDGEFCRLVLHSFHINYFPVVSDELCLQRCNVESFQNCPPIRKLTLEEVIIGTNPISNGSSTLDISLVTIREEADFAYMNLLNYQTLSHLKTISISLCDSVTDVHCFQNVKKLRFHGCPNITDVSCLSKVYDLELSACVGITDISSLGGVHILNLFESANISDISALGNVHTLDLRGCDQITDVSALKNVVELKLEDFDGDDLSGLEKVEKLGLIYSAASDVTMLKNLEALDIYECRSISHFQGLTKLRALTIGLEEDDEQDSHFPIKSGLEIIRQLTSLVVTSVLFEEKEEEEEANSSSVKLSFHHLQNLQSLALNYCPFFGIPATLANLRSLTIYGCDKFTELPDLPFLRKLSLHYCANFKKLELSSRTASSNLDRVYSVDISSCFELRTVLVNRKVSRMIINGCKRLYQLTVNDSIGYLKTEACPELLIDGTELVSCYNKGKDVEQAYLKNHYQDK